jgi:DsbC/DsbD-like thiol-disulfide interchange protein/cytochrome c biogenesis protein CcdA
MNIRRHLGLLLLACSLFLIHSASAQIAVVGDGGPGPVKAQHLTAELVSLAPSIAPGGTLEVGLVITLEEKWHVYWINAGDSGEPPKITWTLPRGVTAGPMQFPIPSRLPLGPLMDFGYEDEVAFPVKLTAAKDLKPGPIHLDAKVNWLVCREVCIPGRAHLGLNLTVDPKATAPAQPVGALGEALGLIPKPLPSDMKLTITGGKNEFVMDLITGERTSDAEFYPFDQEQIANAGDQDVEPLPNGVRLRVPRAPELTKLPEQLHGVLKLDDETAYDVTAPVVAGEVPRRAGGGPVPAGAKELTSLAAISLAFVGGIILNLMPCVFPVLFLKGLSLVQSSNEDRGRIRRHGLVYTLGILVSFWVIVAALLLLRAGGSEAGWGFQLQSPTFLAILASGIFFFALSLSGLFDLGLSLTSVGGELAQKQGYAGSFFTGVLATVVATPCTAPFMGAAIGFALAQSGWITFSVFTALALGACRALSAAELPACVDEAAAAPGRVDGGLQAGYGDHFLRDGDLADLRLWQSLQHAGCVPRCVITGMLPAAGRRGMGAGPMARAVAECDCGSADRAVRSVGSDLSAEADDTELGALFRADAEPSACAG